MAGLTAELENGLIAAGVASAVTSDFAMGASGRAGCAAASLEESEATVLAAAGESVAAGFVASELGSHIRRRAADSSKVHLSVAGRFEDAECSDTGSLAVPGYRCHWPIGHVLDSTYKGDQDDSFRVTPLPPVLWKW